MNDYQQLLLAQYRQQDMLREKDRERLLKQLRKGRKPANRLARLKNLLLLFF